MRKRLPPLSWLCAFEAAARLASFSRAADELFITQSAVSQQIKSLEQYLGAVLFVRTAKGLQLTDAGRNFQPLVSEAFRIIEKGTLAHLEPAADKVEIAANLSFAMLWLAPRLSEFMARVPRARLSIASILWPTELESVSAMFKICSGRGNWPDAACVRLSNDTLFPVCTRATASCLRDVQDLADQALIEVSGTSSGWETWFAGAGISLPRHLRYHRVNTHVMALELAATGHGVALARDTLVGDALRIGRLHPPFDLRINAPDQYHLWTINEDSLNQIAREFRDWLLASFLTTRTSIAATSEAY